MYTYEKCQSYMLEKKKQVGLFSKTGGAVTPVYIAFVQQKGIEKSQTYRGDGINDRCFYICIQILVVAFECNF